MAAKSSDDETLRMPAVNETGTDNGEAARSAQDSAHEPAEKTAGGAEVKADDTANAGAAATAAAESDGDNTSQSVADAVKSADESQDSAANNKNDKAVTRVAPKESWWKRFKHWRKRRPFAGGLLLILSGIAIAAPAYITVRISDLLVMISTVSGVSTLLIGAALIMFGLGSWFRQETSSYLGVLAILVAIIALPTTNLGGFVIGSLLGIIGGALSFAWQPQDRQKSPKKHKKKKKSQAKELAVSA
jgi:hypothetical protein